MLNKVKRICNSKSKALVQPYLILTCNLTSIRTNSCNLQKIQAQKIRKLVLHYHSLPSDNWFWSTCYSTYRYKCVILLSYIRKCIRAVKAHCVGHINMFRSFLASLLINTSYCFITYQGLKQMKMNHENLWTILTATSSVYIIQMVWLAYSISTLVGWMSKPISWQSSHSICWTSIYNL